MSRKKGLISFVTFFHSLFAGIVERLAIHKRRIIRFFMLRGDRSGAKILARFESLIPVINQYKENVVLRLLCMRAHSKGFKNLNDYFDHVSSNQKELADLKENLTFTRSSFFRGGVWKDLDGVCASLLKSGDGGIKVWSAGCSSGMEVYSVLMMLLDHIPGDKIDLLATDCNEEMLRQCREAVYPILSIRAIPKRYWDYLEVTGSQFRFVTKLRSLVKTQAHNLLYDSYPGGFDLILCRNVIKFFKSETVRQEVRRNLSCSLNPGGFLVLSDELQKEGVTNPESLRLRQLGDSCIYQKLID